MSFEAPVLQYKSRLEPLGRLAAPGRVRQARKVADVKGITWNQLMDGQYHSVDLKKWQGDLISLRAKMYAEAYARGLKVQTASSSGYLAVKAYNPWPPGSAFYAPAEEALKRASRSSAGQ